jgi:hypothetical protein
MKQTPNKGNKLLDSRLPCMPISLPCMPISLPYMPICLPISLPCMPICLPISLSVVAAPERMVGAGNAGPT